jgi:hypothetical protein
VSNLDRWISCGPGNPKVARSRDWEKAQETVRRWEAEGECRVADDGLPVSVEHATEAFEADAIARSLKDRTVYKYKVLFCQLKAFDEAKGIRFLKELDSATLRQFRASWKDKNHAGLKKLERLRSFFRFTVSNGWLTTDPTTLAG